MHLVYDQMIEKMQEKDNKEMKKILILAALPLALAGLQANAATVSYYLDQSNALPDGVLDALLADPTGELTDILLYHVVEGKLKSPDVVAVERILTLLGQDVKVTVQEGKVFINDAQVIITDIKAENGIIHVIDAVLIPPNLPDIVDTAIGAGSFNTLVAALQLTGLDEALRQPGPFTVFAPTDDAFAALPDGILDALLANPELLKKVLLYHVVNDELSSEELAGRRYIKTLLNSRIWVRQCRGELFLNRSKVIAADIEASNGTIHVIDRVLIPWWIKYSLMYK